MHLKRNFVVLLFANSLSQDGIFCCRPIVGLTFVHTDEVPDLLLGGQYEVICLGRELCVLDSNTIGLLSSENLHGAIALGYA